MPLSEQRKEAGKEAILLISRIRECVQDGTWSLKESRWRQPTCKSDSRAHSSVWNTFYDIFDDDDKLVEDYVCCFSCKKIYKHLSANGTSKLLRHQNVCLQQSLKTAESTENNEEPAGRTNRYLNDLLPEDKLLISKACSELIIRDLRPVNALYGDGINALLKTYAYICIKYNGLRNSPKEYLPSRHTVSRDLIRQYDKVKEKLKPMLTNLFVDSNDACGAAIGLDVWTDEFRKISYIGATIHYINNEFELCTRVIDNKPLKTNVSKTGQYLLEEIGNILQEYNIDINSNLITFVTDRGSNIVKALEKYTRHNDGPHFLHNTVGKIFLSGRPQQLLQTCTKLVTYIKQAGLNDLFSPSLKSYVETRWNSVLNEFDSIEKNWETLKEELERRNKLHFLNDINRNELQDMIQFLTPFRNATLQMESSKKVTIYWCCVFYKILEKHLMVKQGDSSIVAESKENCSQYYFQNLLEDKMIQIQHLLAVYLHPSLKSLNKMTPIEQRQVNQEVHLT